jgi:indolepyruvate ferredoxin oxidoreductase, alpha subunit
MKKMLLLGDEAIAQAAIDAGISGIYAYPGTPSTEITEYVQSSPDALKKHIRSEWSVNEKTAMEAALGMSYAGKRSMVCMKHVGLNVAADPFVNSAVTGVNGGLIITVADDPSMHSSQNEQDSRFYGKFAMIPILEPSNQQEAYDMVFYGFELSEKFKLPVLLRITTRLAHSRTGITRSTPLPQNKVSLPDDPSQFVLLPANARKRYKFLLELQDSLLEESQNAGFNTFIKGNNNELGIVACGIAYNYYKEIANKHSLDFPVLKINQYPLPEKLLHKIASDTKKLIILEDGYPFVEEQLKGFFQSSFTISGRLDGSIPRDGELNPNLVAAALGFPSPELNKIPSIVLNRPPSLCKGCSHSDVYHALNEAVDKYGKGKVFSDIGCYTLGALPPYNSIYSCVDMGASITMAKGAADAGLFPAVAVIGDSTFTHSGITGLLDAVNDKSHITVIISDNGTTGMTGGQKSSATGKLDKICIALGVHKDHVKTIVPLNKNHRALVTVISEELEYPGVSVIIANRECIQTLTRRKRTEKADQEK